MRSAMDFIKGFIKILEIESLLLSLLANIWIEGGAYSLKYFLKVKTKIHNLTLSILFSLSQDKWKTLCDSMIKQIQSLHVYTLKVISHVMLNKTDKHMGFPEFCANYTYTCPDWKIALISLYILAPSAF